MHHFAYRNGVLHAEAVNLAAVAEKVGTPFYCYSTATIERHYRVFAEAFARARAGELKDQGGAGRVFVYRFDHPGAGPELGATHTSEVPLVFGTWRDNGPGERLGGQDDRARDVAPKVAGTWGRFLHGEAPEWAPFGAGSDEVGVFGGGAPLHVARLTANSIPI